MTIEIRNMIKIPITDIKKIDYKKYIYKKNTKPEKYVQNFWVDNDYVYFPRNIKKFLSLWKGETPCLVTKFIETPVSKKINVSSNFQLLPKQKEAIDKLLINYKNGWFDNLLQAGTGWGKSRVVGYITSLWQVKTIVLVDMTMLQDQMFNEIKETTDADMQMVTKDTDRVADINIATLQLLNRNPRLLNMFVKEIGAVVLDEAQITLSETIHTIVQQSPSTYRLGLSATPTRSDGLTEILHDVFVNKIVASGVAMPVEVHYVEEMELMLNPTNYKKNLNNAIMRDFIPTIDLLVEKLVGVKKKSIMIAVDSKDIQKELAEKYSKYGTAILNSETSKEERESILENYENEKIKILIGYKVLNKGISIPRMEVLINIFAATTKENIEQLIGRLMRLHPKKEKAVFIDFVWGLNMHKQSRVKKETYTKMLKANKINIKKFTHSKYKQLLHKIK